MLIAECKSRIDKGLMTDVLDEFDHVLGSRSVDTYPSNVSGNAKIYLNVGIVIFCLLWYILSIMFDVWYIHLEPTQIIYRNYLGCWIYRRLSAWWNEQTPDYGLLELRYAYGDTSIAK